MEAPNGYIVLDFVGFTDKGDYSASVVYMKNDLVHKKNTLWKCLADNIVNVEPETNSTIWEVFIEGDKPVYGSYQTFPRPGEKEKIYVDVTVDPRLMYTWDQNKNDYVLTGGAGGADGGSVDIPITLTAENWTGSDAPYSQEIVLPQMREEMTPLHFLAGDTDEMQYAYSLITDYKAQYGKITFYASDKPNVNIDLTLKGIPAQQVDYVDNTLILSVRASGFNLNEDTGRYEQTIVVDGMTAGTGGSWDIVRFGDVLSIEESKIAANITDVDRLDGAIKISCTEIPPQDYMISLSGTYVEAQEGDVLLKDMKPWFERISALQEDISDAFDETKTYSIGDYCIYLNTLCRFIDAKEEGPFDGTKVVPVSVMSEIQVIKKDFWKQQNGVYDGKNLADVFDGEISRYSDEWEWIHDRINMAFYDGLLVGDYIPMLMQNERVEAQIAGIDVYTDRKSVV